MLFFKSVIRTSDIEPNTQAPMKKTLYAFKMITLSASLTGFAGLASAQVGVGITMPDPSAQLHVESADKGILIPRVASAAAITSPAKGLLVYQTGAPEGFYYNRGTDITPDWSRLADAAADATPAFASVHNSSGTAVVVVLSGTRVPLSDHQVFNDVLIDGTNTQLTILESGNYRLEYSINLTAAVLTQSRLMLNGSPLPSTVINPTAAVSNLRSSTITYLNTGDIISLELFGLLGVATLQNGSGASLLIEKL